MQNAMHKQVVFTRPQTKIEDWFGNGNDFETTLTKAIKNEEANPKNLDFLADIKLQWDSRGMSAYMSRKVYVFSADSPMLMNVLAFPRLTTAPSAIPISIHA